MCSAVSQGSAATLPKFLYYDVYSLQAVCLQQKKEVRFELRPMPGREKLCWQVGGQTIQSEVPVKYYKTLMKRPAVTSMLEQKDGKQDGKHEEKKDEDRKHEEKKDKDLNEEKGDGEEGSGIDDEGEEEEEERDEGLKR